MQKWKALSDPMLQALRGMPVPLIVNRPSDVWRHADRLGVTSLTMDALEARGLVVSRWPDQDGPYRLTPEGVDEKLRRSPAAFDRGDDDG